MEMHQVRYFLAFCETLNFARAAETCNVSKPALTRECISSGRSWGVAAAARAPSDMTHLTDFGRLVQPHLEQMTFSVWPSQWSRRDNLVAS
jgi:DNA-binding transcriptional LysR family regulator